MKGLTAGGALQGGELQMVVQVGAKVSEAMQGFGTAGTGARDSGKVGGHNMTPNAPVGVYDAVAGATDLMGGERAKGTGEGARGVINCYGDGADDKLACQLVVTPRMLFEEVKAGLREFGKVIRVPGIFLAEYAPEEALPEAG